MLDQLVAGLLMAVAAPSGAQSGADWKWKPDPGLCVLRQEFGAAGGILELIQELVGDGIVVSFHERGSQVRNWQLFDSATVTLEPAGSTIAVGHVGPGELTRGRAISVVIKDQKFLDQLSSAAALTLSHAKFGNLRAPLRFPGAALQALRKCSDARLREWGIDPIAWRALPVKPLPITPPAKWISFDDYPDREANYKNDIIVVVRLDVGPDGSVQGCTVLNRLAPSEFKAAACRALKRSARLQPARNERGEGVSAPFIIQVQFSAIHI